MKKLLQFFALLFLIIINAQAPEKISYQAVIRNASNALITNATVGVKISILKTSAVGTVVYAESQTPTTNANGLISIQIGSGTVLSGTISGINWGTDSYYIKTETDPSGGTSYTIMGTTQLLSVPYALYAKNSGSGSGFTLPYSAISTTDNVDLFKIKNSSATQYSAASFENTNAANTAPAIIGLNNSSTDGIGVQGTAKSNSDGVLSSGISGLVTGSGTSGSGVTGYAANANGVSGFTTDGNGVIGFSGGTGTAGIFQSFPTGYALKVVGPLNLRTIGEGAGKVLTSDALGNATWQNATTLSLPYAGTSAANTVNIFKITNASATQYSAGLFENTNAANYTPALTGRNYSTGSFGTGVIGVANSNTNGNLSMGVAGVLEGNGITGAGLYGYAENAYAIFGYTEKGTAVFGNSNGIGTAGFFQSASTGFALKSSGPVQLLGIGSGAGKVLTSDAVGNATWQNVGTAKVHFSSLEGSSQAISNGGIQYVNSWTDLDESGGANYNATTGEYTIPVTGYYSIKAQMGLGSTNDIANVQSSIRIFINNVSEKITYSSNSMVGQFYNDISVNLEKTLTAGQKIKIGVTQGGRISNNLYAPATNFSIHLIHQ